MVKTIYVVFNINGDIIGVADDYDNAVEIAEKRHSEYKDIREFELNKFYYN